MHLLVFLFLTRCSLNVFAQAFCHMITGQVKIKTGNMCRHVSFRNKLKHQSHHADMNQIPTPVSLMLFATCLCQKSEMSEEKEKPRE